MRQSPAIDAFKLLQSGAAGDPSLQSSRTEANARIRFSVAQALVQGRLSFHFQPVVKAADHRFPAFFEMLARLRLPEGRLLPAGAFMPAVESGPIGRVIDRLALTEALRVLAANPGLRLSVNMSPLTMGDEEWLDILAAAYRGGSGVCGRLILEITEGAAIENADQTIDFMNHVRRMGPAFALDDFGAGATGFRHFREFRFDIVKIDGAFAHGVADDADSQILLKCLLKLAEHFEMVTVAERVERARDAEWLRSAGVDCLQGYLCGRPSPKAELPPPSSLPAARAG